MNVNKLREPQKKVNEALNKSLEQSLEQWLNDELPKMIDEEIQKLQTEGTVEIAVDEDSLEQTKKDIADVIKGCFQ
ncbi:MAG: hypothetical protein IKR85_02520 [Clostridia bacterium]|nr:hypothetical protein [Clostridia bacterium]